MKGIGEKMNNIEIFRNEQFGEVRVMIIDNEPWFVGKDIAGVLGYSDTNKAISAHVDEEDKLNDKTASSLGQRGGWLINESGLYSLILSSKMPKAKAFKRWVTSEVLPQIRKTGGYIPISENETDEEFLARALIVAQNTLKKKEEIIKSQQKQLEIKDEEIEHKENVIIGLVDDIDLATKRQRINQIVRRGCVHDTKKLSDRWELLYSEFSKKYHVNLKMRFLKYKDEYKPRLKNKLDLIDKEMNMIPQLYEVTCKLFENDFMKLMEEWEYTIQK